MSRVEDPADEPEEEYRALQADEWQDAESPETFPSGDTVRADRRDADKEHAPDRPPTADEAERAEALDVDPDVAAAYREATARGVEQEGEGRI